MNGTPGSLGKPQTPAFGTLLRRYRAAAGLTQEELAERAGLSVRGLSDLERGVRRLAYRDTVQRLADGLQLRPADRTALLEASGRAPAAAGATYALVADPPVELTSFVGRANDLGQVRRLLESTRLLTLTGAGGTGKTRMALELCGAVRAEFADGIAFVGLASVADPALLPPAVASAIGAPEQPGRPVLETLIDALQSRWLLLVLDNCEHLVDACAELSHALLRACPRLKMLATSRQPLRIDGETRWRVPSLSLPELPASSANLRQSEAAQLFLERVAAALPTFTLSDANAHWVAEVCRRLDGIPLALELAAARLPALGIEQLARLLSDCFHILTGGSRAALPRQRTLRATLDWSYQLLSAEQQRLFARLAVFASGWSMAGACAVCSDATLLAQDIPELLSQLVDQSLVVVAQDPGEGTRYHFLEPVRQYAFEFFAASDEATALRDRHAAFFLQLAEAAEPELLGPTQLDWLERLEEEHDNMRALLVWTMRTPSDADRALRAATALVALWHIRGYWSEGRRWLQSALLQSPADTDELLRAKALNAISWLAWDEGDYEHASALSEEALTIARRLADAWSIGWSAGRLSHVRWKQGRHHEAIELAREAVTHFRTLDAAWYIGWALHQLGRITHSLGDDEHAAELFEESLTYFVRAGDRGFGTGFQFANLGDVAAARHELERAVYLYEEALLRLRAFGFKQGLVHTLHSMAEVWRQLGDKQQAVQYECEALRLCRDVGDPCGIAASLEGLAQSARDMERELRLLGAAARLRATVGCTTAPEDASEAAVHLTNLRARSSPDIVTRAWSVGAAMSLVEAVDFALSGADPDLAPTGPSHPAPAGG